MKRILIALAALLVMALAGCATSAPRVPVEPPAPPAPAPVVVEQPPAQPDGPAPCQGPVTAGPPSISIAAAGMHMPLPMSDCAISLPAGKVRLALLITNLQQQAPVQVTGAPQGRWEGQDYIVDFDLAQGEVHKVTLDVGAYAAQNPLTYTFTGDPPVDAVLAWGPGRQGPWTAITGSVVPPGATWLRITYPRPLKASSPSIINDDQYTPPGEGLPGDWEGNRVQYVEIGSRKPVLFVNQTADENGLQLYLQGANRLYRGAPPELQRVNPATGAAQLIYQSTVIPVRVQVRDDRALWSDGLAVTVIDLATGQAAPGAPESDLPPPGSALRYPSPDGRWVAELSYPDGPPGHPSAGGPWTVSVTIRESGSGRAAVQLDRTLITWGDYSCSRNSPGIGWRADSQALAVLDAPAQDRLVLKEIDLQGAVRTLAEWTGTGASGPQMDAEVNWAPSGRVITVGNRLVEAATGRTLLDALPKHTFWSPDSRYLLLYEPDHPFTAWGAVGVLDLASGQRLDLGHGQGLGWTAQGEALLIRWDVSREIPPPGKGCP